MPLNSICVDGRIVCATGHVGIDCTKPHRFLLYLEQSGRLRSMVMPEDKSNDVNHEVIVVQWKSVT